MLIEDILSIINKHPHGITINKLTELTKTTRVTTEKYVFRLAALRLIEAVKYGPVWVFYPVEHIRDINTIYVNPKHSIDVDLVKTKFGEYIRITQVMKGSYNTAIMLPRDIIDHLIDVLEELERIE